MGRLVIFLVINFAALGLGSLLIGDPTNNAWYEAQNKAPWTPPGWVFGAAWTTIMLCFSFFMWEASEFLSAKRSSEGSTKGSSNGSIKDRAKNSTKGSVEKVAQSFYLIFALQWILNVGWNPVFFRQHLVVLGLVIIVSLTLVVAWFTSWGFRKLGGWGVLMLPYLIWLMIATSLNAYILLNN